MHEPSESERGPSSLRRRPRRPAHCTATPTCRGATMSNRSMAGFGKAGQAAGVLTGASSSSNPFAQRRASTPAWEAAHDDEILSDTLKVHKEPARPDILPLHAKKNQFKGMKTKREGDEGRCGHALSRTPARVPC